MKNGLDSILKKICSSTGGDTAYVLEVAKKSPKVLSLYGKLSTGKKKLGSLNNLIAKKKLSIKELKKSPAFTALSNSDGFKSIFVEKFFEEESKTLYLVGFTKSKFPAAKTLSEKLKPSIKSIVKNISSTSVKGAGSTKASPSKTKRAGINQSDNVFNEIAGSILPVLYSIDSENLQYLYISEAVRGLFGYSPEDIYKNKFLISRSIEKEHINDFNTFLDRLRGGEYSVVEYKMKDRFGKEHWIKHTGTPIFKNGEIKHLAGMIEDITEEKSTETKYNRTEERFRLLIDTADDLIFILNGFGYFSMVNKNGAHALGYSPEEMTGRHFLEFIDKNDEPKIAEAFNQILSSENVTTFEANFLDRYDKEVTFEIHAKPLVTDGEVSGMISLGRNITNRKIDDLKIRELNTKLIEANRIISIERERAKHKIGVLEELNKLKGEFISNISHELRTPLASIVGFAETITSDSDLPKEMVKEFSGIILSEGKRLAKLINDVLDFSKLEEGEEELKLEPFNLIFMIREVLSTFEEQITEKKLTLTKEFSSDELKIIGDKNRLSHALTNLVSNSIKFTNSGGRISVIATDYGKEVEIAVSDTGVGIPDKDLPRLFQKFSKIQRPGAPVMGTGFGLVSVKQIVDLHKGFIRVTSQENKGTTFIIRLPKQQINRG